MLSPFAKQFDELREVTIQTERMRNAFCVMTQAVSCDLRLAVHAVVQVPEKLPRIFLMTLADVEGRNELCSFIKRHKNPLIANFGRIAAADAPGFLLHVGPNFVNLQML